jgi:hypothetical protein
VIPMGITILRNKPLTNKKIAIPIPFQGSISRTKQTHSVLSDGYISSFDLSLFIFCLLC